MGTTQFLCGEVDCKALFKLTAVPPEAFYELLVVAVFLIPLGQKRAVKIEPLAVPA
jgi:hypothetical protein